MTCSSGVYPNVLAGYERGAALNLRLQFITVGPQNVVAPRTILIPQLWCHYMDGEMSSLGTSLYHGNVTGESSVLNLGSRVRSMALSSHFRP